MKIHLNDTLGVVSLETDEAAKPSGVVILAHGAGAGMHHPFMTDLAKELATSGLHVVRFNFPYMEEGRKSPGSPKKNIESWKLIINHTTKTFPNLPIYVSGKSYGGRMASHLLSETTPENVEGIIYYGFPLHAPGKDSKDRAAHLNMIKVPQLFLQGEKDKLANINLVSEVIDELRNSILIKIDNADHSFNVPKRTGFSKKDMIQKLAGHTTDFIKNLS
ncbi:MAG: alpha/beta fold hydrolase [Cyclobacteriaceae bacterium]